MNDKKINRTYLFIIGLALVTFLISNCSSGTTSTGNKANSNTSAKSAAEIYSKAAPGANPPNALGAPNAPVTLEEFADFQCPTCAATHPKIQELRAAYGDRLRIIFREFPLKIPAHDKAYEAAVAAESAGLQGKFWDMQNLLLTNQQTWSTSPTYRRIFEDYAQKIGLDVEKFKDDMAGLVSKNRVNADLERANSLGLNSTPSVFINGKAVPQQDVTVEQMKKMIDDELQKAQSLNRAVQNAPTGAANNSDNSAQKTNADAEKK